MNKPAAVMGDYVDMRFLPGLKCARLAIDIPIEKANEFLSMFGAPDRASPVKVVVGRYVAPVAEPSSGVSRAEPEGKKVYTRSQIAALKCQDMAFSLWMQEEYDAITMKYFHTAKDIPEITDRTLKEVLGIQSKRELDTNPEKAEAFDKLLTSFDYRDRT